MSTILRNVAPIRVTLLGGILLVVAIVAAFFNPLQFFHSYLFAWLYWLGMTLGGFGLLMLHHLVGGRWGFPVRRIYEAGIRTAPFLAIGALPIVIGLRDIYTWDQPAIVQASEVLQRKHAYLNGPFFVARLALYFAIFTYMAWYLSSWSRKQDATLDPEPTRRLRTFSGPGVCFFFIVATLADVDLILSLEAEWYSTIFAAIVIVSNALSVLAFSILFLALVRHREPYVGLLSADTWHHLGNLLLAFVMLWAYLAFSQLLIIYSGNQPKEIVWYLHRCYGGWKTVGLFLFLLHFAIPFAMLLSREAKRRAETLAWIAGLVLVGHVLDVYWVVVPTFAPNGVELHWQDLWLFVALGILWSAAFLHYLKREPLIPCNDPRMELHAVI